MERCAAVFCGAAGAVCIGVGRGSGPGNGRRNRRETGVRLAPERKKGQSAGPEADGADKAEGKPLYTALDNLTAYGTNRQQTEVEDRHEIWEE